MKYQYSLYFQDRVLYFVHESPTWIVDSRNYFVLAHQGYDAYGELHAFNFANIDFWLIEEIKESQGEENESSEESEEG